MTPTVAVIGGGVAGCAAAVAAAVAGARVVLLESSHHLGGAAARGEHRTLCGLAAIDAAAPELIEPTLTTAWVDVLATGGPVRAGRVWLWPTASDALQAGLRSRLITAGVEVHLGAEVRGTTSVRSAGRDGRPGRVVALDVGASLAVDAVIDASGGPVMARLLGLDERASGQWGAYRALIEADIATGPAARAHALAAVARACGEAAAALTPIAERRWQLSLDVQPGTNAAEASAHAGRAAEALGGELLAGTIAVAERDLGGVAPAVTLAQLFACRERGWCWAAWPRERHGPEGVAWTWPPGDRYGVPEAAARPAGAPVNWWCVGRGAAVDTDAAAALRVTGTGLAMGASVGATVARVAGASSSCGEPP